jgi:hypothetical protein
MNMPGIGNYGTLPERFQTIVDSGISLFELRLTSPFDNAQRIFSLWDVRVIEEARPGSTQLRFRRQWFNDDNAYVEFRPNDKGRCTGMCPDDMSWHNRMVLAGLLPDARFEVMRIHTPSGIVPAKAAIEHIRCIYDYAFRWCVRRGNETLFRSTDQREAFEWMKRELPDHEKEEASVVLGKIAEIEPLIGKYRSAWSRSPEFLQEHKPKIEAMIRQRTAGTTVRSRSQSILEQIDVMSDVERSALVAKLFPGGAPSPAAPKAAPVAALDSEETPLDKRSMNELRGLAKAKEINSKGLSKDAIIAAIEEKLAEEREALQASAAAQAEVEEESDLSQFNDEELEVS